MLMAVILVAPNAIAQSNNGAVRLEPTGDVWAEVPSAADFARVFPMRALRQNVSGRAVLECTMDGFGRLSQCAIVEETPVGMGFGNAALAVSSHFRMVSTVLDQANGGRVRLPLSFRVHE